MCECEADGATKADSDSHQPNSRQIVTSLERLNQFGLPSEDAHNLLGYPQLVRRVRHARSQAAFINAMRHSQLPIIQQTIRSYIEQCNLIMQDAY